MEFTLTYRGPLKSNGRPQEKHALRRHFNRQLRTLWSQVPLRSYSSMLSFPPEPHKPSVIEEHHGFRFAPLVSEKISFVASLSVRLLRPEEPGRLFTNAGDLDNRMKTLLDALKVPHERTALPSSWEPTDEEKPLFCLLQDDSLVVDLRVHTDRLLEPSTDPLEVLAFIHVRTSPVRSMIATMGL